MQGGQLSTEIFQTDKKMARKRNRGINNLKTDFEESGRRTFS